MKRTFTFIFLAIIMVLSVKPESLKEGFQNPPNSAKPRTWWHWVSGNITKTGITADLESMKRVGIQEAQIFNVGIAFPEGPVQYMSDKWLEMFRFATSEANRLGMQIAFNNCAGWSSSGGSWVKPENSMQTVTYSETQIVGGKALKIKLKQPETRYNYYRDIAVWAFPTPQGKQRINNLPIKSLSGNEFPTHLDPDIKNIGETSLISKKSMMNVSSKMKPDGTLEWQAPAGHWTILRIGYTTNGTQNHPATGYGLGLECDKLSSKALDTYWEEGVQPILDKVGPLVGSTLNNSLIDSYEVGCGNWTPGFEKEFEKRCGYNCMTYLPVLAGYYVGSGEEAERFLWDFRKTIGEMMADNYFDHFGELCHEHGMKYSVEPYGGPFDNLEVGQTSDIPMTEFWVGSRAMIETTRAATSAAHLNGTDIVGAESFTAEGSQSRWLTHPAKLKMQGDFAWSEGVNRFIFHTFVHQPWNAAPGLSLGEYGSEMNRLNTWWEQGKAFMKYVARSQYLLQQGKNVADILLFVGESSPNSGLYQQDIKAMGFDYDLISSKSLQQLTVENGQLKTPKGNYYRLLVLSDLEKMMTPELLKTLKKLSDAGAKIIGPKPSKSPSLKGFPACDTQVKTFANQLWGTNEQIKAPIQQISIAKAIKIFNMTPDFEVSDNPQNLNFIHRSTENEEIYFITNQQKIFRTDICNFRVGNRTPQLWNAETGQIEQIASWQTDGEQTSIALNFRPEESYFIVFEKGDIDKSKQLVKVEEKTTQKNIKPLKDLKIIKAEYGHFLPSGVMIATDILQKQINQNHLQVLINNNLLGDPIFGVVKELRVKYTINGKPHHVTVQENQPLNIPTKDEIGEFKLVSALYGHFPYNFDGTIPEKAEDITEQVKANVDANHLIFNVDQGLVGQPISQDKKLRLTFSTEDGLQTLDVATGHQINLTQHEAESKIAIKNGSLVWISPNVGHITCMNNLGQQIKAEVKTIPEPIQIEGPWKVTFPTQTAGTLTNNFEKLVSWTENENENIKYFSGTATYQKELDIPQEYLEKDLSLELDLGQVNVIAEVILNGTNLGILWHAPYSIDLTGIAKAGKNQIEIRLTNLWANRLIGDEQYPEDVERDGVVVKSWPKWLADSQKRDSKRTTFTAWSKWNGKENLQPSGLLGPVIIRPYAHVNIE